MTQQIPTICRACHAGCGVVVEVDGGHPIAVKGDPDNPQYRGFCCVKGQHWANHRNNPNRLLHSQKRQPDGSYRPIPIEQAMDEIAERIGSITQAHGPRSLALYTGTMAAIGSAVNTPFSSAFMEALGSPMLFTSNTIDQPGKMVANALHGYWQAPAQSFAHANVVMLIGTNPLVAMSGGIPHTNPGRTLTQALKRGLTLLVIDPRRTECARRAALHLQPKPGEDVTILAGMLRVILDEALYDRDFVEANVEGVESLREAVAAYTPEYVATRADIPAADLIDAARLFARNGPGVATAGTGPNMSANTTLLEYLVLALNTLCGRWQRAGEQVVEPTSLAQPQQPKAQALPPMPQYAYGFGEQLRVRGLANTAAGMPTAALADEILLPGEGQVRALISHGGNPVSAWPDQLKTLEAFRALELSVQIDITMSATAREADYVIAVKHPMEMPGITLTQEYLSAYAPGFGAMTPYAQYTPAVVDAPEGADLIEDWEFYYHLVQRLGLELKLKPIPFSGDVQVEPKPLDMQRQPSTDDILEVLTEGSRIPLAEVKQHPRGALFPDPPVFVAAREDGWEGRLDVGNAQMLRDLRDWRQRDQSGDGDFPFHLVSRRQINAYNSTGTDNPPQLHGRSYNPAYLHPEDLTMLGLKKGDRVTIRSARAHIPAIVDADANLRRGLVSMTHSWGGAPDRDQDVQRIGSTTGRLTSVEVDYEPYTGLPTMSNIPVAVEQ